MTWIATQWFPHARTGESRSSVNGLDLQDNNFIETFYYVTVEQMPNYFAPNVEKKSDYTDPPSVIRYLVSMSANVNVTDDIYGITPLHYAVRRGNEEAVRDLLSCKDINVQCRQEGKLLTPLHIACEYGHEEITRQELYNSYLILWSPIQLLTKLNIA